MVLLGGLGVRAGRLKLEPLSPDPPYPLRAGYSLLFDSCKNFDWTENELIRSASDKSRQYHTAIQRTSWSEMGRWQQRVKSNGNWPTFEFLTIFCVKEQSCKGQGQRIMFTVVTHRKYLILISNLILQI